MMASHDIDSLPSARQSSPSPSVSPTPAIGACPELSRCVSTASSVSDFSARSSSMSRDSFDGNTSRQSSAGYSSRQSSGSYERQNRRGFVRPQGTNFAASAQSRDSVLSLGSITHIQYYFSRTGLLDGKGGQIARKKNSRETLDLSNLETSFFPPSEGQPRYSTIPTSIVGSPELLAREARAPSDDPDDGDYYAGDDVDFPDMLPPTVSTYNPRQKPLPHPPSLAELKDDLITSILEAQKALQEAKDSQNSPSSPSTPRSSANTDANASPIAKGRGGGWFQVQGMHIIDVMTLAIRAAKMYYTAHDKPARLALIKSEREIRAELLSVMEVLRKMATRGFQGGLREDEFEVLYSWTQGVLDLLEQEKVHEEAERQKRTSWAWLEDSKWPGDAELREYNFLQTMDSDVTSLPPWTPATEVDEVPTPFLKSLQDGQRLIHMHNSAVQESQKKYGAITTFHTDTRKPYRLADNLRFWIKAAELRWEVSLKVDVMGLATEGTPRHIWLDFEKAIWKWAKAVREELAMDLSRERRSS